MTHRGSWCWASFDRSVWLVLLAAVLSSLLAAPAPGLDGVDSARLSLIKSLETDEAVRANIWRWSWGGAYIAGTLAQAIAIPFLKNEADRIDFIVGAISSGFGAIFELVLPLDVIVHAPKIRELPETAEGLAEAERFLENDAKDEDFCVSWVMHAGNVLFNVATGLVLGLGWQHWESAAWNVGIGIVIGEVMVLTTPHNLRALARPPPISVTPLVGPHLTGVAVGAAW